jgi:hypothetical protein
MADFVIATGICAKPDAFFEAAKDETGTLSPATTHKALAERENIVYFFGAEIVDYVCEGDESNYNDHLFKLRVWVGQRMYFITRSYSAFCELDAVLRKKFPRTQLPAIPLSGAPVFVKMTSLSQRAYIANNDPTHPAASIKRSSTSLSSSPSQGSGSNSDSASTQRQSIYRKSSSSSSATAGLNGVQRPRTYSSKRSDKSELIAQKRAPLNVYLSQLFLLPEVLLADCLLYFLDEESVDGQIISKSEATEEISEVSTESSYKCCL